MASLVSDRDTLRKLFLQWEAWARQASFQVVPVWDEQHDRYLLLLVGWKGYQREHNVLVHVELRDNLFWIEADQTPEGFALDLENEGIPKDRIVLGFKHPELRRFSDYAQAA